MPVLSMTGYGFEITRDGYMTEIRSLNGKYLDINIKIPQELYPYENEFRNVVKSHFVRGSIELTISHKNMERSVLIPRLNRSYALHYINILNELSSIGKGKADFSSLLQIRDIVYTDIDEKAVLRAVKNILVSIANVCATVGRMRAKEGSVLKRFLVQDIKSLKQICSGISGFAGKQNDLIRQNLRNKISELVADIRQNDNRFEEEILFFANRMDISEELDRLSSHIKQFESLIKEGGQIGRRLDFLCQEILREFNTIGSKSTMIEIKRLVISGKDMIEKLREQVQNIE